MTAENQLRIYGDRISGNCLKVLYTAERLSIPYEWIDMDILKGDTRTPEFLAMNPAGQLPLVELGDGRLLAQSNAIISCLAEGTDLLPQDPYDRAKTNEWLFWEQYSHEPYIAVCRFQILYLGRSLDELDQERVAKGYAALDLMAAHLDGREYFVGSDLTVADIALLAYTRLAPEGGFDLAAYPDVKLWIARVEQDIPINFA